MGEIKQVEIPFNGGVKKKETQFSPSELTNLFIDVNSKQETALISTHGLSNKISFGMNKLYGVRAMLSSELIDNMFLIVGDVIYQLDSGGALIFGKKITTFKGFANIVMGNGQIIFVDGVNIYIYDIQTGNYIKVTNPNAPPKPGMASVLGGRFFVNELESDRLHISDINDGTSWQGNIITLSDYPEIIVGHATLKGRLFLLGTRSSSLWYLSDTYPYAAKDPNILLEYGCASTASISVGEDRICWLAKNIQGILSIVSSTGGVPQNISSEELEAEIQSYKITNDADGFIYENSGIVFYQINFRSENKSFLYNFLTNTWSSLEHKENECHLISNIAYFKGKHYMGANNHPAIYELDNNTSLDYDTVVKRKFITNIMYPAEKFIIHRLRIFMQQGTGISAVNNDNGGYNNDISPKLFLSISRDGGINYGNALEAEIGAIGKRETVCDFYRLGYFDYGALTFKFEHYSHTPCNIYKILMNYSI